MRWATIIFAVLSAVPVLWAFDGSIDPLLFLFLTPVFLGGGWLMAFYMWHLSDAVQYDVGPLRPAERAEKEKTGDV